MDRFRILLTQGDGFPAVVSLQDLIAVNLQGILEQFSENLFIFHQEDGFRAAQGGLGIVEDEEKLKPQIIFGHEVEPVNRIQELNPHGVLITSLDRCDQREERLRTLLNDKRVFITDISLLSSKA